MMNQIAAALNIFLHPKRTMQELPSDRLYALAVVNPLFFGVARAFRPRTHAMLHERLGGNLQIVLFAVAVTLVMLPLGGWLMQRIVRLFRKRLSVMKILNISGYAYVPRLVVAVIGYAVLFANPSVFLANRLSPALLALIVLGSLGMIYTIFLTVYGLVVAPSEGPAGN